MKQSRTRILIAVSSLALIMVLIIQVNWILKTARIKEELFNEKANMILSRTAEAISSDKETCRKISESVDESGIPGISVTLGRNEVHKIDSIFRYYMKYYNFHIDYAFEVIKPGYLSDSRSEFANYIYNKPLEEVGRNSELELKLVFPEKKQFILAEMGILFITSVILILIVLFMFWRTVLSLIKERRISEHTTEFLNNMTHEFKTPLTNIALAGKMIIKDPGLIQGSKTKHYSEIILAENEKLRLQVEQVLSITALERGEIPLRKTEIDFHEVINDSIKYMSIQMEHRQGDLKVHQDAVNSGIFGDKTHLTNAVCNLIDNAIKYSREQPEISISTFNSGSDIVVVVSDKGPGIEKEFHKKVFAKFFRVPTGDVHDVKGFGLGLAYTKKIIEMHGGSIKLQSEKGKGTTFTITLSYV